MDRPVDLPDGTFVQIQGLVARPDLNGTRAEVVAFISDRKRYQVKVDGGEELYLKHVNLKVTETGSTASDGDDAKDKDAKSSGRKVTMNDLFADPDCDSETAGDKLKAKNKLLDGQNQKQRVHIQKAAVQGEFGAKKFIKP
jgi:hypothetical protein|mmetsp:Transcript_6907/g.26107  ORF Transcript_6907/g.26107 Transcript_6907/m.26107 type:complete len:141 (-) Transcript_6907:275-697(-)